MADELTQDRFDAVEDFICATLLPEAAEVGLARSAATAAGLPPIEVMPNHGKLLNLLARAIGARRVLEVGTLGGYSTLWLARALPDGGQVVTLEIDPRHAEVARASLDRAGVGGKVDIRVGPAAATLEALRGSAPFDLVFIDADKENNPTYLLFAVELARPGALVVLDNAVWRGQVADPGRADAAGLGVRAGLEFLGASPLADATVVQTVGSKGWDGFALALVTK